MIHFGVILKGRRDIKMYIYARINKNTLKYIREKKAVSFDYIEKITKFSQEKISAWENEDLKKFPTINQAKSIAKCYHIPFAGLYMNAEDINIKHLPKLHNLRTMPDAVIDNSALNLAIADVMEARELLIESKKSLKEIIPMFLISGIETNDINQWAKMIRNTIGLTSQVQYKCSSARQLYLFVRNAVEEKGAFVHCFIGVKPEVVRGFAIYDDVFPVIGLNNEDRYPAKTFSIIHELVHLVKRSSAVCNEMQNSSSTQAEEVFCNAVAGEVLVPTANLLKQVGSCVPDEIDFNLIESLANKFSVSKEVVCRRLLDTGKIPKSRFSALSAEIQTRFESEREKQKTFRKITGKGIPRNISREAIDQNSSALCRSYYRGFREGYFDKQDVARYLRVKQDHVDKFMMEASKL